MQPLGSARRIQGVRSTPTRKRTDMRNQLLAGALAVAATSALGGPAADAASARTPDRTTLNPTREVGTLLECTGTAGDVPVRANIYQNRTHGNVLELLVNDGTK